MCINLVNRQRINIHVQKLNSLFLNTSFFIITDTLLLGAGKKNGEINHAMNKPLFFQIFESI